MPSNLLERSFRESAYQQPDAVFDRPLAPEAHQALYGEADVETVHSRDAKLAPSIGSVAVNPQAQYEWLYDVNAAKSPPVHSQDVSLHPEFKKQEQQYFGPRGESERPSPLSSPSVSAEALNSVDQEKYKWIYGKQESGPQNMQSHERPADQVHSHDRAGLDPLSHIHVIGQHTLEIFRRAHKLIPRK
jgi:hypothetical protein